MHTNQYVLQRNQTDDPDITQYNMDTWFLMKEPEIHTGKNKVFSTYGVGQTGWLHIKKCK